MPTRRFDTLITHGATIETVARQHLTLREAKRYVAGFNAVADDSRAIILPHPIARAISRAIAKSRAS